jgi:hypothetical protein
MQTAGAAAFPEAKSGQYESPTEKHERLTRYNLI